ncbi:hypothetical protein MTP10_06055 [Nonomuraea sp. 3-1Str]|uniref:hypothetical protein n=1 Tax=Nonomuraea sp. 3-1Str TaxID=2929801 RepID=UPI0028636B63|nr:hypothetical protein [Nonomuraea sp. 3-1Str]MDR8408294.1 hypothetical protein [Nonomuraea sp. 3-1Str]
MRSPTGVLLLLVATPSAVNLAGGGPTWIWTPSLPAPLLRLVAEAGLLDAWLVADLLAAVGILGGLAVAATAARDLVVAATLLALVAAVSLAAAAAAGAWLPLVYALAYTAGLMLVLRAGNHRRGG